MLPFAVMWKGAAGEVCEHPRGDVDWAVLYVRLDLGRGLWAEDKTIGGQSL